MTFHSRFDRPHPAPPRFLSDWYDARALLILLAALALALFSVGFAQAAPATGTRAGAATRPADVGTGTLLFQTETPGLFLPAPVLATEVRMSVAGMIGRAAVSQRFVNPSDGWVEGVYVFPLPEDAAVDRMRIRIGEKVIEAEIAEREEARKVYEAARDAGQKASLLDQERPNIFTTSVANIGPGEEVTVEIEYQETIRYDRGAFVLRFPMVVGPRYIPAAKEVARFTGAGWGVEAARPETETKPYVPDLDRVPDAARITPPVLDPALGPINPVVLTVELDPGVPLAEVTSPYHPIEASEDANGRWHIALADGAVPADRDFELIWRPKPGAAPAAGLFTEKRADETYHLVMVMPPLGEDAADRRVPRDVVFVIDTSGSMEGHSIAQAREALNLALVRLRPEDRFNVISFADTTTAMFPGVRPADPETVTRARRAVARLIAEGGTEMLPAIEQALAEPAVAGRLRQVIFLTDGAVGNEDELFTAILGGLGESRLFTIGIGSAPNGYFMTRAAEYGRGTYTFIGDVDEVADKMAALFEKLEVPVLTDIALAWPDGVTAEIWPARVPDLYRGEPVVVAARVRGEAAGKPVTVTGQFAGTPWQTTITLGGGRDAGGVGAVWARRKIAALMGGLHEGVDPDEVRRTVIPIALAHRLVTRYTSLVAVDVTPSRPEDEKLSRQEVPTNLPYGWTTGEAEAMQQAALATPPMAMMAVPEPAATQIGGWAAGGPVQPQAAFDAIAGGMADASAGHMAYMPSLAPGGGSAGFATGYPTPPTAPVRMAMTAKPKANMPMVALGAQTAGAAITLPQTATPAALRMALGAALLALGLLILTVARRRAPGDVVVR